MKTIATTIQSSMMKNVFFVSLFLIAFSCDQLLDVEVDGTISGDILTNEENIQKVLVGAYYNLAGINDGANGGELLGGDFKVIPELLTRQQSIEISWDDVNSPTYSTFMDKNILNTNIEVESNWRRGYEVINAVNSILENIENVEDATARMRIEGEAKAIRGILYFEMVRLWGPQYEDATVNALALPLILKSFEQASDVVTPELATVGEVYSQVENDLLDASDALESFGKNGVFISYHTCQAYLMRLSMHIFDFANAQRYAENIINSGLYSLVDSPLNAFNNTANTTEDIFAIQQTPANNTGDITSGSGLTFLYSSISGQGPGSFRIVEASLTSDFIVRNSPLFWSLDVRGSIDTTTTATTTADQVNAAFYRHVTSTERLSQNKFASADQVIPVVRLAEVYLTRGEAILEQTFPEVDDRVVQDLNLIRMRAGLPELSTTDFGDASQLRDTLVLERRREFYGEGLLFHDLKRWSGRGWRAFIGTATPLRRELILKIPLAEQDTWFD